MYIVLFLTINRSQPSIAHQFTEMMTVPLLTAACQRLFLFGLLCNLQVFHLKHPQDLKIMKNPQKIEAKNPIFRPTKIQKRSLFCFETNGSPRSRTGTPSTKRGLP